MLGYSKKHKNVGRRFKSPYFDNKIITVVEWKNDDNWRFVLDGEENKVRKNGSKFSYFVEKDLEVGFADVRQNNKGGYTIKKEKTVEEFASDIGLTIESNGVGNIHLNAGTFVSDELIDSVVKRINERTDTVVKFAKINSDAIIPSKEEEDGGRDVYASLEGLQETKEEGKTYREMFIPAGEVGFVPTGIASALDDRYFFNVNAERSSVGKYGINVLAGVIDSSYRGEWKVMITHPFKDIILTSNAEEVEEYDNAIIYPIHKKAIAQATLLPVPKVQVEEISYEDLAKIPSKRGTGGWGSSGK